MYFSITRILREHGREVGLDKSYWNKIRLDQTSTNKSVKSNILAKSFYPREYEFFSYSDCT